MHSGIAKGAGVGAPNGWLCFPKRDFGYEETYAQMHCSCISQYQHEDTVTLSVKHAAKIAQNVLNTELCGVLRVQLFVQLCE